MGSLPIMRNLVHCRKVSPFSPPNFLRPDDQASTAIGSGHRPASRRRVLATQPCGSGRGRLPTQPHLVARAEHTAELRAAGRHAGRREQNNLLNLVGAGRSPRTMMRWSRPRTCIYNSKVDSQQARNAATARTRPTPRPRERSLSAAETQYSSCHPHTHICIHGHDPL